MNLIKLAYVNYKMFEHFFYHTVQILRYKNVLLGKMMRLFKSFLSK